MKEDLKKLGELFKQTRIEKNLSLKEAENATSIRVSLLEAIEEGELKKLISPVYAQGFMRQYAGYLGLDAERFFRENPDVFAKTGSQEFSYGIGTLEVRGNPGGGIKWLPNVIWILAFGGVLAAAWYFASLLDLI